MKRLLSACLACLTLFSLAACGAVRDDVPVQVIADAVGSEVDGYTHLSPASDDFIRYCMKSDLSLYEEHLILCPFSGSSYNEIGIFKLTPDADRENALSEVRAYLTFRRANWDMRYNADECIKVEHARVISRGRYLFFAILSDAERNAAESAFRAALQG